MNRARNLIVLVVTAVGQGAALGGDPVIPGSAVIRVAPGVPVGTALLDLRAAAPGVSFSIADVALADRRLYLLSFEPPSAAQQVELVLENPPASLDWGELLYEGHAPEASEDSILFFAVGGEEHYLNQYAIAMLGLPQSHTYATGADVVVAVLDTGIDASHPLLAGSIIPGGFNFIAGNSNTNDVGDGIDNDGDGTVDESVGHGTFVAGLIHLVAPDADLLPIVVLNSDGVGDTWVLAQGLFYAIDQGVDVINLSLGSTYNSATVEVALEEAKSLGIVVVAAGGNQNAGEEFQEYPAANSASFGVAALDDLDVKADFSNFGEHIFISAPGTSTVLKGGPDGFDPDRSIYSALPGSEYGIWEGTGFSAAFVSGAAALVRAQHPDWPTAFMIGEDIVNEIKSVLGETSVEIYDHPENQGFLGQLGVGRLDAGAATLVGAGDVDADGNIGITDLLALLAAWGPCLEACRPDLDADGFVGITDFLILLGNWG